MKKLLVVLGLALSAFSFQASAATFNLGLITDSESFAGKFTGTGPFSDTYNFTAPDNTGISGSATNAFVSIKSFIANFAATLDGNALNLSSISGAQFLEILLPASAAGSHSLVITGTSTGTYGGSIAVAQTPIPAAVWLFGSALMGLTGISRRKGAKA